MKAFTDMYYSLNHDGQNDYQKLKKDFQIITDRAIRLEHQCLYPDTPFDQNSATFDHLQDDYRSYKDKGSLKKRIESIKTAFQSVKITINNNGSNVDLSNAYRKLANESFMMVTDSHRQLLDIEQKQSEKQVQTETRIKPKAPLVGSNGNIFNLMGIATHSLKDAGMEKEAEEMFERITHSGSYDEALVILMEYVEPVENQELQQNEMSQQML